MASIAALMIPNMYLSAFLDRRALQFDLQYGTSQSCSSVGGNSRLTFIVFVRD